MSIKLDAREVLNHLNHLGYRNITAEQLKEFIRDLKKLIKYENNPEKYRRRYENEMIQKHFSKHKNELLYMRPTESSKAKRSSSAVIPPSTTTTSTARTKHTQQHHHETDETTSIVNKSRKRPKSRTGEVVSERMVTTHRSDQTTDDVSSLKNDRVLKEVNTNHVSRERTKTERDKMWIRPRSTSRGQCLKKSDPVALYHHYQSDWNRFKDQIPIDNKHLELRWAVRQKTLGGQLAFSECFN